MPDHHGDPVADPAPGEQILERVQQLTDALEELPDGPAREIAEDLVGAMVELYGEGLERILAAIDEAGEPGAAIRARLVDDGVVASLLLIHDLYPIDLATRVEEALAGVRPYLESHGGDVELLGLADGVARIRLVGHCRTCPASTATLELAIQQALDEAAPDLLGLEVEGMPPPRPVMSRALPVVTVPAAAAPTVPAWLALDGAAEVAAGTLATLAAGGAALVVANVGGTLYAYRDGCPGCQTPLGDGALHGGELQCSGCGRSYDLARAGRAADGASAPLEPVPLLRREAGDVEVALAV